MHRAADYLASKFPAKVKKVVVQAYVLTAADAAAVVPRLRQDANDYYYSACISVIDGLRAVDAGFFTWSTVKFYYSVFYSLRAILAWNGVVVFWPEDSPFHVAATAGSNPSWASGKGSHKCMANCFRKLLPTHFLLRQDIELMNGIDWLLEKRESANYRLSRFQEPAVPEHYTRIVGTGVRQAITAYLDPASILTFDKDHAIVSFPLAALRVVGDLAKADGGAEFSQDELAFLRRKARERSNALAPLLAFIVGTLRT